MGFRLPTGCDLRGPPLTGPTLMGFGAPSAYEARGSDLHRDCLTRLCCASRLSQPPDAFFLPGPSRLCFTPLTLLGFYPPEVFPPDPPGLPLGAPAPLDVPRRWSSTRPHAKPSDPCLCPERNSVPRNGTRGAGSWASSEAVEQFGRPSQSFPDDPVGGRPSLACSGGCLEGRLRGATPGGALRGTLVPGGLRGGLWGRAPEARPRKRFRGTARRVTLRRAGRRYAR
jgi:hypothetical protein